MSWICYYLNNNKIKKEKLFVIFFMMFNCKYNADCSSINAKHCWYDNNQQTYVILGFPGIRVHSVEYIYIFYYISIDPTH